MKYLLSMLIVATLFISCKQKKSSDPKIVLIEYYEHIKNGEFEEAKAMSDNKNKEIISRDFERYAKEVGVEKYKQAYQEEFGKFHMSIGEPVIDGKYAIIPLYSKGIDVPEHQKLEREDDTWIVMPVMLR